MLYSIIDSQESILISIIESSLEYDNFLLNKYSKSASDSDSTSVESDYLSLSIVLYDTKLAHEVWVENDYNYFRNQVKNMLLNTNALNIGKHSMIHCLCVVFDY